MIDHIGIVCYKKEVNKLITLFKLFGYKKEEQGIAKKYKVKCIFLHHNHGIELLPDIELIIPLNYKSVVSSYLQKNKNRLHHIAFEVDNLKQFKHKLKPVRVKGAKKGMYVTFLDPKKYGLLIELVQYD